VQRINDGASMTDLAEEHGIEIIKYGRGIQHLITLKTGGRDPATRPEIYIFWGASGTGKTRKATSDYTDAYIITKPNSDGNLWWDGYQGQETVILDEFYGWIKYDMLLRLLDRYPIQVPVKGGFVKLRAHRWILTSNKPWTDWYPNIDDTSALKRRIQEWGQVTEFKVLKAKDCSFNNKEHIRRLEKRMQNNDVFHEDNGAVHADHAVEDAFAFM